jgi:hypothetical protein
MSFWANVFLGKCLSGQMSFWANVLLGKCLFGPMSFWANVLWANVLWEMSYEQMSIWANVVLGKCLLANVGSPLFGGDIYRQRVTTFSTLAGVGIPLLIFTFSCMVAWLRANNSYLL